MEAPQALLKTFPMLRVEVLRRWIESPKAGELEPMDRRYRAIGHSDVTNESPNLKTYNDLRPGS